MYETPDAPDGNTSDFYEDAEAEAIERLHISSDQSINKFKGKYLTGHVDYAHNDVRGGCWELAAHGEKESPIEKYRRIKCEMDELMNEIVAFNGNTATTKTDRDSYEAVSAAVTSAQKVLGSLKLEKVLGCETIASASESEIKKLIAQVDSFSNKANANANKAVAEASSHTKLEHTKRIAELEARLHRIEAIVGTQQPERLNRLASVLDTNGTLLDSVQQIQTKAALLQPNQLDQIEARVAALTSKINAIHEKSAALVGKKGGAAGGGSGEDDAKVTALYDIAKKTEPMSKLLPDMLQRMKTLESLHNQGNPHFFLHFSMAIQINVSVSRFTQIANNFNKTIDELESTQSALGATLNGNKALLQKVQETFALNLESVNKDVGALENRLKAAEKK